MQDSQSVFSCSVGSCPVLSLALVSVQAQTWYAYIDLLTNILITVAPINTHLGQLQPSLLTFQISLTFSHSIDPRLRKNKIWEKQLFLYGLSLLLLLYFKLFLKCKPAPFSVSLQKKASYHTKKRFSTHVQINHNSMFSVFFVILIPII